MLDKHALSWRDDEALCYAGFDSGWCKSCSVRRCSIVEVDAFIKAHYLAKRPAIVLLCLVAERDGKPIRVHCVLHHHGRPISVTAAKFKGDWRGCTCLTRYQRTQKRG